MGGLECRVWGSEIGFPAPQAFCMLCLRRSSFGVLGRKRTIRLLSESPWRHAGLMHNLHLALMGIVSGCLETTQEAEETPDFDQQHSVFFILLLFLLWLFSAAHLRSCHLHHKARIIRFSPWMSAYFGSGLCRSFVHIVQ